MPNMDYSLVHRTPTGNGQILVTTPGTPDIGSYVTEADLLGYIAKNSIIKGYYYNSEFYEDALHTTLIPKQNEFLYIDLTSPANLALFVCLSSAYKPLTEEASVQAVIDALNDGSLVPLKAKQDQNGNVIDTTYATKVAVSPLLALGLSVVNGRVCQTYNL